MRKSIKLGFIAASVLVTFGAWVLSDNGRAGSTNSPGEGNCTSCHSSFALNSGGGSIYTTSTMNNWQYVPGQTYTINVIVKKTGVGLFGFDIEALTSTNANAGTFVITNATKTQIKNATISGVSRANVVHQFNGGLSSDSSVFSFNWTAPATNVGNVTLYYTGDACNNNGSESGDYVYSGTRVVTPLVGFSISGTVFNDANGLTDNTVGGAATTAGGLYANLLNGANTVVATALVVTNGTYNFSAINAGSYSIQLSTVQGIVGQPAPAKTLPATYVNTGEFLGAGVGNDGLVNGLLPVTVAAANLTNANFGIERLPVSNNLTVASQSNPGGTLKVVIPALAGIDAEDGALGSGKSVQILSLPLATKGLLYYNNVLCTLNQIIAGYNPALLSVDPAAGALTVSFTYSFLDAAGKASTIAGIVKLPFVLPKLTITPTTLLPFTATTTVPSATQSFTLSGVNLFDTVKVTAPTKFQISKTGISGWTTTIKLPKNASNQLPATIIYVRYKPTVIGTNTGTVNCVAAGATTKKITVTGTAASRLASQETEASDNILLVPNPVVNEFSILNLNTTERTVVTVYNLAGSKMQSYIFEPNDIIKIDVSSYKNGLYLCAIESGNRITTRRFVKQ